MIKSIIKVRNRDSSQIAIDSKGICIPIKNDPKTEKFYPIQSMKDTNEVCSSIGALNSNTSYCIFAYGQTGSGKTYTMIDSESSVLKYVIEQELENASVSVEIFEIYNEKLFDLLNASLEVQIKQVQDEFEIPKLTKHEVKSMDDFDKLLTLAVKSRSSCETQRNSNSSRSHLVIRISNSLVPQRYINIIDLAGSERIKNSGVSGINLIEAQYINKSLLSLSRVFFALMQKSSHVPFRDSQLTKILQNQMRSNITLISCIDPINIEESLRTLDFADVARKVEIQVKSFDSKPPESEESEITIKVTDMTDVIRRAKKMIQRLNDLTNTP